MSAFCNPSILIMPNSWTPPMSDPKTPFSSEEDYTEALKAHHMVMAAAVKAKQTVDPANADALEAAIDLCCKMYLPL